LGTHPNERFNFAPFGDLLGTHSSCDLSGITFNAGNDGVGVGSLLRSFVGLLDDDHFLSGMSAGKDNSNLSWFVD
jgi:hypothetical protein